MKKDIHPKYTVTTVTCGCGDSFVTRSTKPEIHVEICSRCHPFYTGKQKLVDSAGQVEKFRRRYGLKGTDETESNEEDRSGETAEVPGASAEDK